MLPPRPPVTAAPSAKCGGGGGCGVPGGAAGGVRRIRYRYRTFAERLGPQNAKSIVLHYLSVLLLSYVVWSCRAAVVSFSESCE